MQLWVSKLNKNKWKIALIILSVALVTSCIFGVTTAWFNSLDSAKANVAMDVKYIDIFAGGNGGTYEMIPTKEYTINPPTAMVNETEGTYCVFLQISEIGGTAEHKYLNYTVVGGWNPLTDPTTLTNYKFPVDREDTKYYYQIVDASQVNSLAVLQNTVTVTENTTYAHIQAAQGEGNEVILSVIAAGCEMADGATELPTAAEVADSETYVSFL